MSLAIVVPTLNEAKLIATTLTRLAPLRARGAEIIVVDGGSSDETCAIAAPLADHVISAARGRASQMNAGAAMARHEVLLFLHADTQLPSGADSLVLQFLKSGRYRWGRFDVRIDGSPRMLRIVSALMNWRSRLTGIATGDQAIFVTRSAFEAAGRFPEIALMEDIALSRRLLSFSRPACIPAKAITSGRRWETHGVWRTILLMWWLRIRYRLGASPQTLAKAYAEHRAGHRD
jgi:rSAM/selenodomain-associated transferase 2